MFSLSICSAGIYILGSTTMEERQTEKDKQSCGEIQQRCQVCLSVPGVKVCLGSLWSSKALLAIAPLCHFVSFAVSVIVLKSRVRHKSELMRSIWHFVKAKKKHLSVLICHSLSPPPPQYSFHISFSTPIDHKSPISQESNINFAEGPTNYPHQTAPGEGLSGSIAAGWDVAVGLRWHGSKKGELSIFWLFVSP